MFIGNSADIGAFAFLMSGESHPLRNGVMNCLYIGYIKHPPV